MAVHRAYFFKKAAAAKNGPGIGETNRDDYLAAIDGIEFGDTPESAFTALLERLETDPLAGPLDPQRLNRFLAAPKRLFGFDRSHVWERYGEMNEYPDVSWIEGPWMLKHKGTYYLQYSASGTQWLTYATGMYMSKSPAGPFIYAAVNPALALPLFPGWNLSLLLLKRAPE